MKLFFPLFFILLLSGCQAISTKAPAFIEVSKAENTDDGINNENIETETETVNVNDEEQDSEFSREDSNSEEITEVNHEEGEGLIYLVEKEVEPEVEITTDKNYKNIWLKLAEGFSFEVPDNARIAKQRDYYLSHPTYLDQVSKRAEPFLWLIVEQIEKNDLPLELALLPLVESTFDPYAYSSSGAAGLWQFMPVTGIRYGLKQDWWYDGRLDVVASTKSALQYMQVLHEYLGEDWLHAFAAYNSGEGRVERAVNKNKKEGKPVDYWNLSLPGETEKYVPKFLALIDILRNHKKYGITLPNIPNKKALTYVSIDSQIDLAYAADLANLSLAEIQLLNPAFKHWATSPNGPHKMLLPNVVAKKFTTELAKVNKNQRIKWDRYVVKSGDNLSLIAQNNKTTTSVLKQINDLNSASLKVGQPLLIPIASQSQQQNLSEKAQRSEDQESPLNTSNKKVLYTVVEGDTLWDISRRYKVTSKQIAKWNRLTSKHTLQLGQELTIWKKSSSNLAVKTTPVITYLVRSGDSLDGIALKFNVQTDDLVRWNNIQNSRYIQPGQKIKVYAEKGQSNT